MNHNGNNKRKIKGCWMQVFMKNLFQIPWLYEGFVQTTNQILIFLNCHGMVEINKCQFYD